MGYIFDPEELQSIARSVVGQPIDAQIDAIRAELGRRHGKHVAPAREWVFNNAGGAMGAMLVLHASITEYVIIFGTPLGTTGHSGRFAAEDYFMMLQGEHWCFAEGETAPTITRPGECTVLPRGRAKAYRLKENSWALEYARGFIPFMLPFGFADTFSSTLDFDPLWRTVKLYGAAVTKNLLAGKI
ncbi:MAG: hypothetical protein HY908_01170 [Myxococcales bacterium]|nr:hypothetical protein [Myxococcales bacterium]